MLGRVAICPVLVQECCSASRFGLADRAPETVARLVQKLGVTISLREFLTRSGVAAAGGTLGGLVALRLDPERAGAATVPLAVAPDSNVNWEVD